MKKIYILIAILVVIGLAYFISSWQYSDGTRAGTVSKISKKGYIFKTVEGELNVGGFSGETGSMITNIWKFSVDNDSVYTLLKKAQSTGERVTLSYDENLFKFVWNGDTKYMVKGVEFLNLSPSTIKPDTTVIK
ncbi:MAG: hypothetical protein ACRCVT_06435 [Leadbetterella sp.]